MSAARPLRVLIVDDNRDAADGLARLARLWGHDAACGYDAAAAFALAVERPPDVVLSDLAMPGMDGLELADLLTRHAGQPRPHLVAVTGFGDDEHRRLAAAAGFDRYFVKPVDVPALRACLAELRPV